MTNKQIAMVAHEVNRAYCEAIGDNSQLPWGKAPKWQQQSSIDGVNFVKLNPESTPEQIHEAWVETKRKDGWNYGTIKNPEKKQHPCITSYTNLPTEQKVKDSLYQAVVLSCFECSKLDEEKI